MATMRIVAAPMKVAPISKAGGKLRIKVEACGICHCSGLSTGGPALITKVAGAARTVEVQHV